MRSALLAHRIVRAGCAALARSVATARYVVLTLGPVPAVSFGLAACERGDPPAASHLRDVARATVMELEARANPAAERDTLDDDGVRRLDDLVTSIARDSSPLRSSRVQGIRDQGDAAVPFLALVLADFAETRERRAAACALLGALDTQRGTRALAALARAHPDASIRSQCAYQIASASHDVALVPLLAALQTERDDEARAWIAAALTHFHDYAGVEELTRLARESARADVRATARSQLEALVRAVGVPDTAEIERRWKYADPEQRLRGAEPSASLKLDIWRRLARASGGAADTSPTEDEFVLARLPAWGALILAEALADTERSVRARAAAALTGMGPRGTAAGPTLLIALARDREIERELIVALAAVHHGAAREALEARLRSPSTPDVRAAAARALGRIDEPRSIESLERAIDTREPPSVRANAALSLLAYDRPRGALSVLAEALARDATVVDRHDFEVTLGLFLAVRAQAGDARDAEVARKWADLGRRATEVSDRERFEARVRMLDEIDAVCSR